MKKSGKLNFIAGFAVGAFVFGATGAFAAVSGSSVMLAAPSTQKIYVDGTETLMTAYSIEGNNYVRLRDVGRTVNFGVTYDDATNSIRIDTTVPYTEETATVTVAPSPTPRAVVIYSDANPPIVGVTPGKIMVDNPDPALKGAGNYEYAYSFGMIGQCAWYAKSRFAEVNGIAVNLRGWGNPKGWLDVVEKQETDVCVIRDIDKIENYSIAVYDPGTYVTYPGHAVFVEYVERGADGKPEYVYLTETNGYDTVNSGVYGPGHDGVVRKVSFEKFKTESGILIGYIAPVK
jgi:hypothetical protein